MSLTPCTHRATLKRATMPLRDALREPQANRKPRTDPTHPGWGADISDVFRSFVHAERGRPRTMCDVIDDRTRSDGKWRGMQDARVSAVTGRHVLVVPGGQEADDVRAAEELNAANEQHGIDLHTFLEHAVRSPLRYGWGLAEEQWEWNVDERRYDVTALFNVRCRNTQIATTSGVMVDGARPDEILVQIGEHEWQVARQTEDKYIEVRGSVSDPAVHAGLGGTSAAWSTMKMQAVAGNLLFLDRFGLPFLEAVVADWSSESDKETAREILRNFGRDVGVVTAKNAQIMLKIHDGIQSARASTSDTHGRFIAICDHENAVLWNGSGFASQQGQSGSSYALAQEQAHVEFRLTLADVQRVARATERDWFRRWMRFNGLPGKTPRLRIFVERVENPAILTAIIGDLAKVGYRVDPRQIEERTGLRQAQDEPVTEEPA